MFRKHSAFAIAALWALVIPSFLNAQLASRPAEEWSKTLDQPTRVESLKIPEIVARLGLKPGQIVADLGAGTCLFCVPMARAVAPRGTVYAVEIDKGYFATIEGRAKEANLTNVKTVLGEFKDPKLPSKDVDVAFMHDVLHHVEDRAGYLKNAVAYVKPGGRFVIIDYKGDQGPHKDQANLIVSEEQVNGWMKASGFGKVERVDLFPDKYFLIFSR